MAGLALCEQPLFENQKDRQALVALREQLSLQERLLDMITPRSFCCDTTSSESPDSHEALPFTQKILLFSTFKGHMVLFTPGLNIFCNNPICVGFALHDDFEVVSIAIR